MLGSLQHKRFTIMGNQRLSVSLCYWHVRENTVIEPIGNVNDSMHKRPRSIRL